MTQVMHLNVIQDTSVLSIKNVAGLQMVPMGEFMQKMVSSIVDRHSDWPDDATHKVKYRTRTWPTGWDKEWSIRYFTSEVELDLWLLDQMRWAYQDDNGFEGHIQKWDFGPEFDRSVSY